MTDLDKAVLDSIGIYLLVQTEDISLRGYARLLNAVSKREEYPTSLLN